MFSRFSRLISYFDSLVSRLKMSEQLKLFDSSSVSTDFPTIAKTRPCEKLQTMQKSFLTFDSRHPHGLYFFLIRQTFIGFIQILYYLHVQASISQAHLYKFLEFQNFISISCRDISSTSCLFGRRIFLSSKDFSMSGKQTIDINVNVDQQSIHCKQTPR